MGDGREEGKGEESVSRNINQDHIPVRDAAVCLDCDSVFRMQRSCPGCSSTHWVILASWIGSKLTSLTGGRGEQ